MNCWKGWLNNSMTFEKVLLDAIDEGLHSLGEETKQAFYSHLKNQHSLTKQDIPYRIEDFTQALEDVFQVGAKLLEIEILKILYSKLGPGYVPLERPENFEFSSYVYALRNRESCFSFSTALC